MPVAASPVIPRFLVRPDFERVLIAVKVKLPNIIHFGFLDLESLVTH